MAVTIIHAHVEGIQRLKNKLKGEYMREVRRKVNIALFKTGEFIMELSRDEVPVDTGDLFNSSFIRAVRVGGNVLMVKIGYDDWKAAFVHEDITKAHGDDFNAKYAAEIAAGLEHARGPHEKARFLYDPIHDNLKAIRDAFRVYYQKA